jgi:cytochrome c oxidase subunit 3
MNIAHGEQVSVLEEEQSHESSDLNAWGMIFFLASEALVFANFIAAYLYLEIMNLPKMGAWLLDDPWMPLLFTLVLLLSSGTMHLSGMAIRKGNRRTYAIRIKLRSKRAKKVTKRCFI